eukprot:6480572-Amphidinium_carterae.1
MGAIRVLCVCVCVCALRRHCVQARCADAVTCRGPIDGSATCESAPQCHEQGLSQLQHYQFAQKKGNRR